MFATSLISVSIGIECIRALDITQNLPSAAVTIGLTAIGLTSIIAGKILRSSKTPEPEKTYALPPIFLFERHDDPTALRVAYELLPKLKEIGYSVYCVEISDIYSSEKIIDVIKTEVKNFEDRHGMVVEIAETRGVSKSDLGKLSYEDLLKLLFQFFDNKDDTKTINTVSRLAEAFHQLEHHKLLQEILRKAQECGFSIQGVDDLDARKKLENARPNGCFARLLGIFKNSQDRINQLREQTMARNIEQLRREGKGVLYVCGHMHDFSLIEKCPGALSYFIRSPDSVIKMNKYFDGRYTNAYLQTLSDDEISSFADKIVTQIQSKGPILRPDSKPN